MTLKATIFASVFSASLVTAFFVSFEYGGLRSNQVRPPHVVTVEEEPLAQKQNFMMSEHAKSSEEDEEPPRKGGLAGSVAYMSLPSTEQQGEPTEFSQLEAEQPASSETDLVAQPVGLQLPEGIAPILRKGANGVEIGNFRAASIAGDSEDCLSTAFSMLSAAGVPDHALNIMVATKPITIAKFCAQNGVVIFTCRNNTITVSPRRARPDSNCPSST